MTEAIDNKRELARLKRQAQEIAAKIHDIVEERLFEEADQLPELSRMAMAAVEDYRRLKNAED